MKLRATKSFSGVLGNAAQNTVFDADDDVAAKMKERGYPVEEVADEAKRTQRKRRSTPREDS